MILPVFSPNDTIFIARYNKMPALHAIVDDTVKPLPGGTVFIPVYIFSGK